MPTTKINYDNTIIYKLVCKDVSIPDIYVGHTTNFVRRKQDHKKRLDNPNHKEYNIYKTRFIREHGGWANWDMIEICKVSCVDAHEARRIERQYIEELGATLNKNIPSRTFEEYTEVHRDYYNLKRRQYRLTNLDEMQEKDRLYYLANREAKKARSQKYREEHEEELREKRRIKALAMKSVK